MLKFFRDQKDSWFVKGILILTALSFMTLFGVSSSGLSFDNKTVVSVGSTKVSTQELMDKFRRNVDALSRMTGGQFTLKDAVERGMLISTLRETGSRAAMNETVNHLGLAVPEDAVRQSIMNEPMFSGLDGTLLFDDGEVIMEIKTSAPYPLWLVKILSDEKIFKTSFSKYGSAYLYLLRNNQITNRI